MSATVLPAVEELTAASEPAPAAVSHGRGQTLPSAIARLWLMPLATGHEDDSGRDEQMHRCQRWLDAGERSRLHGLRAGSRREEFVLGHALARFALSALAPSVAPATWRLGATSAGRPVVIAPDGHRLQFNITHSRGMIAVAVCAAATLGVDVEFTGRKVHMQRLARRFFAPSEVAVLMRLPEARRRRAFFACWTLKEAYLKARGAGLRLPLAACAFDPETPAAPVSPAAQQVLRLADLAAPVFDARLDDRADDWRFALFEPGEQHLLALALPRSVADVHLSGITPARLAAAANG